MPCTVECRSFPAVFEGPRKSGHYRSGTSVRSEPGAYQNFYAGIAAMLRGAAPPPVLPEDAVAGLQIIEAAQRSAAEHRVIALNSES